MNRRIKIKRCNKTVIFTETCFICFDFRFLKISFDWRKCHLIESTSLYLHSTVVFFFQKWVLSYSLSYSYKSEVCSAPMKVPRSLMRIYQNTNIMHATRIAVLKSELIWSCVMMMPRFYAHLKGKSEKTPFPKREILIAKFIYKSIYISLVMRLTYTIFSQNVRMQSVLFLLNNYLKIVFDAIFFDNKGHIMQIPVPEGKTVTIHSTWRIVI